MCRTNKPKKGGKKGMKKRVISVLLCTAMVASMLIGCGGKTTSAEPESDAPEKGRAEDFDWKKSKKSQKNGR